VTYTLHILASPVNLELSVLG